MPPQNRSWQLYPKGADPDTWIIEPDADHIIVLSPAVLRRRVKLPGETYLLDMIDYIRMQIAQANEAEGPVTIFLPNTEEGDVQIIALRPLNPPNHWK